MGGVWSHFRYHNAAADDRPLCIVVTTGDRKGAGTDANVRIVVHDEKGQKTDVIRLNRPFRNDHERGSTNRYYSCSGNGFGKPRKLELWRDSFGVGHSWYLERIEVEDSRMVDGQQCHSVYVFPIYRWIRADRHYIFREYDCILPQEDDEQEQRRVELKESRRLYQYALPIGEGGPAQIKAIPEDEEFSEDYKWDIVKNKGRFLLDTKLIRWTTDKWESIADLKKVYKFSLGEPQCLECWNEDKWFGLQRVQGVNCVLITLSTEIPEKFAVTPEMVAPFLEGLSLLEAMRAKRIFHTDLAILKGINCKDGRLLCHPMALFFLNKHKELMPIAIQLLQDRGPDNPVYLPNDPPYTWLMAKMYYNSADASYHQSCTHLGFTHLLMEGVVICTHRNLSPSHPIFKLLAPHFLYLIAINTRGLEKLISPGGWVDKTMTLGRKGMFELIIKGVNQWQLNVHGMVPNEIRSRGVDSPEILPHYPYRDDATVIFDAIYKYVSKIVRYFYDSDAKILEDYELHQWRSELVKSKSLGGCGLQGIPGDENERFTNVEEIVDTMTAIICTCSLGHAASNFQQYDEYGFPPNYPALLAGDIPKSKDPFTEQDIVEKLPTKEITLDTMVITKLLSIRATKSLGDFELQYLYDPVCCEAAKEFREDLDQISQQIKIRNRSTAYPYNWLDPEFIPNAISI